MRTPIIYGREITLKLKNVKKSMKSARRRKNTKAGGKERMEPEMEIEEEEEGQMIIDWP